MDQALLPIIKFVAAVWAVGVLVPILLSLLGFLFIAAVWGWLAWQSRR